MFRRIRDLDRETLRALAGSESGSPVLSIYSRTDPRDPANTNHHPAWEIELRNGLGRIEKQLEAKGDHEELKRFRKLSEKAERGLNSLVPSERARSVAWFLGADGEEEHRYALQLPVRHDAAVWEARPFISPLVDVVERGTATGLVVVASEQVRLLHVEMGHVTEPEDSTFALDVSDWRSYEAYAAPNPARGQQSVSHIEHFESRLEEQRARFFETAAHATDRRLAEMGWERVLVLAEPQVSKRFSSVLPRRLADRVVAVHEFNAGHDDPVSIAAGVEPKLEQIWLDAAVAAVDEACDRAAAGGPATVGPQETLGALGESRVGHLLIDPDADFSEFAAAAPPNVGGPAEMLAERAIEAGFASGARVSAVSGREAPRLHEVGGMAAILRY